MRELQLVGEKRLLSVQQEADAAARQARVAHEQEVTALQVRAGYSKSANSCVLPRRTAWLACVHLQ